MADDATIRDLVEKVVADALASGIPGIRRQIVQRVMDELHPLLSGSTAGPSLLQLKSAIASVQGRTAQSDILRALLDGVASFCGRVALFLVRGNSGVGWQSRGFRDNEAIKLLTLDLSQGLAARAVQQHSPAEGPVSEITSHFISGMGAPASGTCVVAPLVIREKVSGLLYADAGMQPNGHADSAALEILVQATATWLELLAIRKSAAVQSAGAQTIMAGTSAMPELAPRPANGDSAAPASAAASLASATAASPAPVAFAPKEEIAPSPAPSSGAAANGGDDELHRKARRFAKLLVDEIKLYNQAKVAEGKLNHDLYDRLRDDIDKSRATYDRRYAQSAVAGADYFVQELVRNLADGNPALLGNNLPR